MNRMHCRMDLPKDIHINSFFFFFGRSYFDTVFFSRLPFSIRFLARRIFVVDISLGVEASNSHAYLFRLERVRLLLTTNCIGRKLILLMFIVDGLAWCRRQPIGKERNSLRFHFVDREKQQN